MQVNNKTKGRLVPGNRYLYAGFMAVVIVVLLAACSSYQYYAIQGNQAEFNHYRSFAWLPPADTLKRDGYTDIADDKIKTEATAQLEKRGLVLKPDNPDLLVRYSILLNNRVRTYAQPVYTYIDGYYPGILRYRDGRRFYYIYRRPYIVYAGAEIEEVPYKEGTLIIDLVDRRTQHVVWRGYGVGEVINPEQSIGDIPEVVNGIISRLPLQPIVR